MPGTRTRGKKKKKKKKKKAAAAGCFLISFPYPTAYGSITCPEQ